jgi:hydroxyacylglutathione hydrolase
MEELNLKGPPNLKIQESPHALTVKEFETEMNQPNATIVDTRMPHAFAGSFIPNSISIWMGGSTVYPGWLLDYNKRILFVHERNKDMKKVAKYFWRLGYDLMDGYLCNGISEWQERGKPIDNVHTISVKSLKEKLERKEIHLIDVREPHEWSTEGFIEGSQRIFFGHLPQATQTISKDKPVAVTCSVGKRSSIAASILKRAQFTDVYNVLGGMTAWTRMGYPKKNVMKSTT